MVVKCSLFQVLHALHVRETRIVYSRGSFYLGQSANRRVVQL